MTNNPAKYRGTDRITVAPIQRMRNSALPKERPVYQFETSWDRSKTIVQASVLLDTGCEVLILSSSFCRKFSVPRVLRDTPIIMLDFADKIVEDAGKSYTGPVRYSYKNHTDVLGFKVTPTDEVGHDSTIFMDS